MSAENPTTPRIRNNDPRELSSYPKGPAEEWKLMQAKGEFPPDPERTKIYENPNEDPTLQAVEERATRVSQNEPDLKMRAQIRSIQRAAFVKTHPEKAEAYKEKSRVIKKQVNHEESRQKEITETIHGEPEKIPAHDRYLEVKTRLEEIAQQAAEKLKNLEEENKSIESDSVQKTGTSVEAKKNGEAKKENTEKKSWGEKSLLGKSLTVGKWGAGGVLMGGGAALGAWGGSTAFLSATGLNGVVAANASTIGYFGLGSVIGGGLAAIAGAGFFVYLGYVLWDEGSKEVKKMLGKLGGSGGGGHKPAAKPAGGGGGVHH